MVEVMNKEIRIANKNAEEQKIAAREAERKVDEKIAEHNRRKMEREEAEMREQQRIKEEKEREVQRLREMQERAQDRQAGLDQIRAQKAFEKAELELRAKQAEKQAKHQADLKNLHQGRQQQFADIDAKFKEEARIAREQHLAIVNRQKREEEEEKAMKAQRRDMFLNYKSDLNSQMNKNEVERQNQRHEELIEGKKTRMLMDEERSRI